MFSFGFESRQGFAGALADQIALNLCRQSKSKSQHLGLYVIAQAVTVFNRPHLTFAMHAITQYLHDHVETSAQTAQLATDYQIPFLHMPQQFSQLTFRIRLGTRHRLFYPSIYLHSLTKAKLLNFKPLVNYCLLVATYTNITLFHQKKKKKVNLFLVLPLLQRSHTYDIAVLSNVRHSSEIICVCFSHAQ